MASLVSLVTAILITLIKFKNLRTGCYYFNVHRLLLLLVLSAGFTKTGNQVITAVCFNAAPAQKILKARFLKNKVPFPTTVWLHQPRNFCFE
jgi:hypothetical protein